MIGRSQLYGWLLSKEVNMMTLKDVQQDKLKQAALYLDEISDVENKEFWRLFIQKKLYRGPDRNFRTGGQYNNWQSFFQTVVWP